MAVPIYILINDAQGLPFLHILTNTCYLLLLFFFFNILFLFFYKCIYLLIFIFGCVGSSFLREGFL